MGGKSSADRTSVVSDKSDYEYMDPMGQSAIANAQANGAWDKYSNLVDTYDPNSYLNAFLAQSGGLANMVSGLNAPLAQSLDAIAARDARLGGEAALAAMPGMRGSGAAMAAFGDAYANPFAKAQAQLQQNQLEGTLALWDSVINGNLTSYGDQLRANTELAKGALDTSASLANNQGAWYQPTYVTDPTFMESLMGSGTAMAGGGALATGVSELLKALAMA